MSDPVPWNEAQFPAVFQEHVSCTLLGVYSYSVVGDDGTCGRWNLGDFNRLNFKRK